MYINKNPMQIVMDGVFTLFAYYFTQNVGEFSHNKDWSHAEWSAQPQKGTVGVKICPNFKGGLPC